MKKHDYSYFSLLLILLFFACTKEPLPVLPEGNNPIYTLKGMMGDDSLHLDVGMETVVLNHGVEDEFGVLSYFSEMESVRDNEKLKIEIVRQELPRNGGTFEIFKANQVPFLVHEKGTVLFDFGGVGNQLNTFQIQNSKFQFFFKKNNIIRP